MLLQLRCIYRLIDFVSIEVPTCGEVWVSISICSDHRIIEEGLSVRNSTRIYRLISSIIKIGCVVALSLTPCRLRILLPSVQTERTCIGEVRIHFGCTTASVVMKLNVLVHRAHGTVIRNEIACPGRQNVNWVWIEAGELIDDTCARSLSGSDILTSLVSRDRNYLLWLLSSHCLLLCVRYVRVFGPWWNNLILNVASICDNAFLLQLVMDERIYLLLLCWITVASRALLRCGTAASRLHWTATAGLSLCLSCWWWLIRNCNELSIEDCETRLCLLYSSRCLSI